MLEIVIHQPGAPDSAAKLPGGAYLVGAAEECHIRIIRPDISRRHAQFVVHDDRLTVMDLGSRNGTVTDDGTALFPHEPYEIRPGRTLRLGKVEILVRRRKPPRLRWRRLRRRLRPTRKFHCWRRRRRSRRFLS